ncbi:lipoyl(octanoyl) transferase LipB, partial [Alistipes sp. OttesenSCG-928-L06]|nr:lipoyl(octanoyl) transferase LipB [Alistipes sp. OttesenSCG-928-L06]
YAAAWETQQQLFDAVMQAKLAGEPEPQTLLLCEHPHVYTLGKSGVAENLLVSDDFLRSIGATKFKIDRGGDITYHGYGQLVGYPILDIETFGMGLKDYIHALEEAIIRTVADYGIVSERLDGATGVWLEKDTTRARKIAAIGVKASRFVTMHGFALNVNTDLKYFSYINPCGFVDKGVTSLQAELGREVDFGEVKMRFVAHFKAIFNSAHKAE